MPHNLIPAQESPVPLPKFQMVSRCKILMSSVSKKGTQIYYTLLSESLSMRIPSTFPYGAPMQKDTRLQGIFTYLLIYLFLSFPQSSVRKPPPFSLTVSPWTGILRHRNHWSIYSCMSAGILLHMGKKHKITVHGAPRRWKAYIQWGAACFPRGFVNDTAVSTPVPCSPRHNTFHLGRGRPEPL